jgi:DNA mismatch repair ATPase MutL
MKKLRSILAIAVIATSVSVSISPAQALTWEEIWGAFKQGIQNQAQQQQQSSSNNSEAPQQQQSQQQQSSPNSSEAPQQQSQQQQPQPQEQSAPQRNYAEQSSSEQRRSPMPRRMLRASCVKVSGYDPQWIDRDSQDSTISVGMRAIRSTSKLLIGWGGEYYQQTCGIQVRPSSGKVRVAYAIPDNSTLESVRVSIYVDGQEKVSRLLHRGQAQLFVADITGARSYAVSLKVTNGNGDIHYPALPPAAYY